MNLSIPLANGDELMLVGVDKEASNFGIEFGRGILLTWDDSKGKQSHVLESDVTKKLFMSCLGTYDGEIDFDAREDWVKSSDLYELSEGKYGIVYDNYLGNMPPTFDTPNESLTSLLRSETAKAKIKFEKAVVILIHRNHRQHKWLFVHLSFKSLRCCP